MACSGGDRGVMDTSLAGPVGPDVVSSGDASIACEVFGAEWLDRWLRQGCWLGSVRRRGWDLGTPVSRDKVSYFVHSDGNRIFVGVEDCVGF